MFFSKNEVIEIDNKKEYFILDVAVVDGEIFYQIQEVESELNNLTGAKEIIKAINVDGALYIEELADVNQRQQLNEIFTS